MKNVLVLMSTFNGERFIDEQLISLLNQKNIKLNILIRDDGSSDRTVSLLKKYKKKHPSIKLILGNNIGAKFSFLDLIHEALKLNMKYDYYAFCDQDDYWKQEKLITAVNKLNRLDNNTPNLYIGQTQLVDSNLNYLKTKSLKINLTFEESLMIYCATGCTMVFNLKLLQKIGKKYPSYFVMHDTWVYQVCLALGGKVIFDNIPQILYRQHNNNVFGGKKNFIEVFKARVIRIFVKSDNERYNSAIALLNDFNDELSVKNKSLLKNIKDYNSSIKKKLSIIFSRRFVAKDLKNNFSFRIAVLFGIY